MICFLFTDYLQEGRSTSVQGPDLENQNSLDSGESHLFTSSLFVLNGLQYFYHTFL